MRVLIYGAGVIGQIYAGRLHEAGHEVTVLARHRTCEALARGGIALANGAKSGRVRVPVTDHIGPDSSFELALVTVRRDQVAEILPALAGLKASSIVMMQNNALELATVGDIVGADRVLFGFPGVGGYRMDRGVIKYIEVPQQPTILGRHAGREEMAVDVFKSAGLPVTTTADMDGWLKTHAVFIAGMCASINSCAGDAAALAADRERVATMIKAVGEGFRALTSKKVAVAPLPLKVIFTVVPRVFAVRYWQGQLRGPVGTVAIAPHSRATKGTELPALYRDVQKMVAGTVPTPHLDELLSRIGKPAGWGTAGAVTCVNKTLLTCDETIAGQTWPFSPSCLRFLLRSSSSHSFASWSGRSGHSCPPPVRRRVMKDTTVTGLGRASDSGANTRRRFFGRAVRHADEDELLARVLITSWSLATGRTLRAGVAPQSLTEDELISFWADDQIAMASRAVTAEPVAAR
jgi:2-dehydropantoate 2-reductase